MQLLQPDDDTLCRLVELFGLEGVPRRLTPISRGGNGQVWRLDLDGPGPSFAVKELFAGGDEQRVVAEVEFRDLAVAAGIRAPQNLRTVDGRYLAQVGGAVVRVSSWVDGREPRPDDPGVPEWLGRTLATLHTLGHPFDPDQAPTDPPIPDLATWLDLADLGTAAGQPWATTLARAAPGLAGLGARTQPVDPNRLVFSHHDVQPSNVLFDPKTQQFVLLDWDGAGPIDPGRELASRLYTWHVWDDQFHTQDARRTLRAYRAAGGHAAIGAAEAYGGIPDALGYIENQARASLNDTLPAAMREHSARETCQLLGVDPDDQQDAADSQRASQSGLGPLRHLRRDHRTRPNHVDPGLQDAAGGGGLTWGYAEGRMPVSVARESRVRLFGGASQVLRPLIIASVARVDMPRQTPSRRRRTWHAVPAGPDPPVPAACAAQSAESAELLAEPNRRRSAAVWRLSGPEPQNAAELPHNSAASPIGRVPTQAASPAGPPGSVSAAILRNTAAAASSRSRVLLTCVDAPRPAVLRILRIVRRSSVHEVRAGLPGQYGFDGRCVQ